MTKKDQNAKEKLDGATKAVMGAVQTKKGKMIAIGALVILIAVNVLWTMAENIKAPVEALKTQMATLSAAVAERTPDLDAIKADVIAINKAEEAFNVRLDALLKAEEARLARMTQEVESQKLYLEELKKLKGDA